MWRLICAFLLLPVAAAAQFQVGFQGLSQDSDEPIEIAADEMTVNNDAGTALLTGNVIIIQGDMRLSANVVDVTYTEAGGIDVMVATGNVLFVTPEEEVESERAVYEVKNDMLFLTGDVLMLQGQNVISSDKMDVDIEKEVAFLEGRVRSIIQPEKDSDAATDE